MASSLARLRISPCAPVALQGGIDCHVAYCRWGAQDNQLYNRRYGLMGYSRLCFKQRS